MSQPRYNSVDYFGDFGPLSGFNCLVTLLDFYLLETCVCDWPRNTQ